MSLSPTPLIAASNVKAPAHARWADGPQTSTNGAQCQNVPGVLAAPFSVPPRVHLLRPPRGTRLLARAVLISGRGLQRRTARWLMPSVCTTTAAGGHREGDGHSSHYLTTCAVQRLLSGTCAVTGSRNPDTQRRHGSAVRGELKQTCQAHHPMVARRYHKCLLRALAGACMHLLCCVKDAQATGCMWVISGQFLPPAPSRQTM